MDFYRKNLENSGKNALLLMKMYSSELFSSELLREKFENDLDISGKT